MKKYINELKILFKLSLPLIISYFLDAGRFITDSIMVGRIDKYNISAMALSTSTCILISLIGIGAGTALTAELTKYYAKQNIKKLTYTTQQFIYIIILLGFVSGGILYLISLLFANLSLDLKTIEIAQSYLFVIAICFPITILVNLFRPIMQSFLNNKIVLYMSLLTFSLNIPLNYIFIYYLDMGALGCAISTVLCTSLEVICLSFASLKYINIFEKIPKIDKYVILNISKLSIPVILIMMLEEGFFSITNFLVSRFGEISLGAHHVSISVVAIVFMIQLGASFALMQRVSYLVGKELSTKVTIKTSFWQFIIFSIFLGGIILYFRNELVALHTKDMEIAKLANKILIIAFIFHLFDSMQACGIGILRAFKKDDEVVKFAIFSYWGVGLAGGVYLSQYFGVFGIWYAMTASLFFIAVLYWIKIYNLAFKNEGVLLNEHSIG